MGYLSIDFSTLWKRSLSEIFAAAYKWSGIRSSDSRVLFYPALPLAGSQPLFLDDAMPASSALETSVEPVAASQTGPRTFFAAITSW